MEEYLLKQKELITIAQKEANKIVTELISKNVGESTMTLRKETLDCLYQNQLPEEVSFRVKKNIDDFISNLTIPTQL